jgi:hypothetical protein
MCVRGKARERRAGSLELVAKQPAPKQPKQPKKSRSASRSVLSLAGVSLSLSLFSTPRSSRPEVLFFPFVVVADAVLKEPFSPNVFFLFTWLQAVERPPPAHFDEASPELVKRETKARKQSIAENI